MNYTRTRFGCYGALFTQAVVNNLAPILFIVFQNQYHLSYESLGRLVLFNFMVQLLTDVFAARFADKLGPGRCMVLSHLLSAVGLAAMAVLPSVLPSPYVGLCISAVLYAIGGGLNEVLASPILEALPSKSKSAAMNLLHSFYSWGQVLVVLLSTLYLKLFPAADWRVLPIVWAVIPLCNMFVFLGAPIVPLVKEGKTMTAKALFSTKRFALFLIIMLCAGASELSMAQWSSMFAQKGLGVDKFIGDLAGPCLFAVFMGIGRVFAGSIGERIRVRTQLLVSSVACFVCYLLAALAGNAVLALFGCAFCGITVAVLWPATYSLGSQAFPRGGAVLFGLLAMAGDMGCSLGPWLTGAVSDVVQKLSTATNAEQFGLHCGILAGAIFPLVLAICLLSDGKYKKEN